jgi:hypothetical protein
MVGGYLVRKRGVDASGAGSGTEHRKLAPQLFSTLGVKVITKGEKWLLITWLEKGVLTNNLVRKRGVDASGATPGAERRKLAP